MKRILAYLFVGLISSANPLLASGSKGLNTTTVRLETRMEESGISIVLHDEQVGIYHHFILEQSLDGKNFVEVGRAEENKDAQGSMQFTFKVFPFERNSIQCVFYRIRAVDELGWFDFTNTVTIMKKEDLARRQNVQLARQQGGQF